MRLIALLAVSSSMLIALPGAGMIPLAGEKESRLAIGIPLPVLEGSYLTGKKARLPEASQGKIALLALGFTYESRHEVEKWSERFAGEFAKTPDFTFYEIPLIGGIGRIARWFIDSGMRRGTPKERHENVITVYGSVDPWKQRVGYDKPDDAYLILIDRQGTIRWLHAGPFDEPAFAQLSDIVRSLGNE